MSHSSLSLPLGVGVLPVIWSHFILWVLLLLPVHVWKYLAQLRPERPGGDVWPNVPRLCHFVYFSIVDVAGTAQSALSPQRMWLRLRLC